MKNLLGIFVGAIIAFVLLWFYAQSVVDMVNHVVEHCKPQVQEGVCSQLPPGSFNRNTSIIGLIGGLVSALVISILGISSPKVLVQRLRVIKARSWQEILVPWLVLIYVLVWIYVGTRATYVGLFKYDGVLAVLTEFASTWLGLAVAGTYVFFGLAPPRELSRKYRKAHGGDEHESKTLNIILQEAVAFGSNADDLSEGQKVPNAGEAAIVGALSKKIIRDTPEFKALVKNENIDIVFKDEEGTGADQMMTQKLKGKLDTLAIKVKEEWPGVKLRVTEAWDEENEHAQTSLHYEARSADLTTSPIDGSKLGRLARLAVEAGFDWVFYEDTTHIHVSMRR